MKRTNIVPPLLLLASFGFGQAMAANGGIELKMIVNEEVVTINEKGEQVIKLIEPESILPGDTIVYTTFYQNKGDATANNVAIKNPIPPDTIYTEGSAEGKNSTVEYSIDGGKTYALPEHLTISDDDDRVRPATARDYTNIRWIIKALAPDANGSVSFRAKVK